jgi:hypothetical protein
MQYAQYYLIFANLQIRLKEFKNINLNRWLNDVYFNTLLALLEVTIMHKINIDDIYNLMIYLYCNLDRIATKYFILINKTYLHGNQR